MREKEGMCRRCGVEVGGVGDRERARGGRSVAIPRRGGGPGVDDARPRTYDGTFNEGADPGVSGAAMMSFN